MNEIHDNLFADCCVLRVASRQLLTASAVLSVYAAVTG